MQCVSMDELIGLKLIFKDSLIGLSRAFKAKNE